MGEPKYSEETQTSLSVLWELLNPKYFEEKVYANLKLINTLIDLVSPSCSYQTSLSRTIQNITENFKASKAHGGKKENCKY